MKLVLKFNRRTYVLDPVRNKADIDSFIDLLMHVFIS